MVTVSILQMLQRTDIFGQQGDCVATARHAETANISDDIGSDRHRLCGWVSSCGMLFTGPAFTLYIVESTTRIQTEIQKTQDYIYFRFYHQSFFVAKYGFYLFIESI